MVVMTDTLPKRETPLAAPQNGDYPQNFDLTLGLARRAFDKLKLREVRSDRTIRLFVSGAALLIR
jgi:hypothetical protein